MEPEMNIEHCFIASFHGFGIDLQQTQFLFAVSGGADSVAMLLLAQKFKLKGRVLHCNFNLRGAESNADEAFVKQLGKELDFPVFVENFDTKNYAQLHKISIQMAARNLRYEWFERVRKDTKSDFILLGHHQDDMIETMLINLFRGTGLKGLIGIPQKNEHVFRPLLNVPRSEIENFLNFKKQIFRNDSSNDETKYMRNKIRHLIIPEIKKSVPEFEQIMVDNSQRFLESQTLMDDYLSILKTELFHVNEDGSIRIEISHPYAKEEALYFLCRDYGFNRQQIGDLYSSKISGKQIVAKEYILLSDRNVWILEENKKDVQQVVTINDNAYFEMLFPIHLEGRRFQYTDDFKINPDKMIAQLDYDTLGFPLTLRKWEKGDWFIPLGMKGRMKLSDFFINRKLNVIEKEAVWVICSGNDIVWVAGMQIDNRVKITLNTTQILEIRYKSKII
jgi:tRNA(Ile)-lysidine synthase